MELTIKDRPEEILNNILSLSWKVAQEYISLLNSNNICCCDWQITNSYDNGQIRNLYDIVEGLSLHNYEFFEEMEDVQVDNKTAKSGWPLFDTTYRATPEDFEDIKLIAKDKPEFIIWYFCNVQKESVTSGYRLWKKLQDII